MSSHADRTGQPASSGSRFVILVRGYRDRKKYPLERTSVVALADHKMASRHRPCLEVRVSEWSVGRIDFEVQVEVSFEGLRLHIRGGRIKQIDTGECRRRSGAQHGSAERCQSALDTDPPAAADTDPPRIGGTGAPRPPGHPYQPSNSHLWWLKCRRCFRPDAGHVNTPAHGKLRYQTRNGPDAGCTLV